MEATITPFNEISNTKENLMFPEEPDKTNDKEIYNVNQYFVDNEDKTPENEKFIITFCCCRITIILLIILILIGVVIPVSLIEKLETFVRIIIILGGVILALISLIFSTNKLEITKDLANNKATIKVINFLCFSKKTIKIDLDNIYFYLREEMSSYSDGSTHYSTRLIIVNTYKNLSGIDLDNSDIKSKPVKFLYNFSNVDNGIYGYRQLNNDLNNFVGASGDNPLTFNIDKYMTKNIDNNFNSGFPFLWENLSRYMKFSENYFTFHLRDPLSTGCFKGCFIFFTILSNLIFIALGIFLIILGNLKGKEDIVLIVIGVLLFVIPNIILYLIYKCLKKKNKDISRIDIIYSKDFDRIFIGLVKYIETSYVNTFEFQLDNINRFILEKIGRDIYSLKVIFKNDDSEIICNIKKSQEELKGLAFILNERLNNNINDNKKNTINCDNN